MQKTKNLGTAFAELSRGLIQNGKKLTSSLLRAQTSADGLVIEQSAQAAKRMNKSMWSCPYYKTEFQKIQAPLVTVALF